MAKVSMISVAFLLLAANAPASARQVAGSSDSQAAARPSMPMTGQMGMDRNAMPHQHMMAADEMQNCQSMNQRMLTEMQAMRRDMANLRTELRRRQR